MDRMERMYQLALRLDRIVVDMQIRKAQIATKKKNRE